MKELAQSLEKFHNVPILVIGDLIVDHYIWGKVDRISPEAPVVVVKVTNEERRLGGAGNVVSNLHALGAKVIPVGVIGDDESGRLIVEQLQAIGVDVTGLFVDKTRPTTIKSRVIAHAQQVVRVDREVVTGLSSALEQDILSYIKGKLGSVKGVIISDYAKGVISPDIFTPFLDARTDIGIKRLPLLIDPKPSNLSTYKCATVIKPNRSEAERLSGKEIHNKDDAITAGRILLEKWDTEMVLITLGDLGMVLVSKDDQQFPPFAIDTEAREVYDVSGAGDTVSAVFTLGLAAGITPYDSARLANYAAGIVVGEIGTVAVTSAALRQVLDENL